MSDAEIFNSLIRSFAQRDWCHVHGSSTELQWADPVKTFRRFTNGYCIRYSNDNMAYTVHLLSIGGWYGKKTTHFHHHWITISFNRLHVHRSHRFINTDQWLKEEMLLRVKMPFYTSAYTESSEIMLDDSVEGKPVIEEQWCGRSCFNTSLFTHIWTYHPRSKTKAQCICFVIKYLQY